MFVLLFRIIDIKIVLKMLDDAPPPAKRMKLQKKPYSHANKENHDPNRIQTVKQNDVRKRKVPIRKPTVSHILDLNAYVLLEVFDYLPLQGKYFLS